MTMSSNECLGDGIDVNDDISSGETTLEIFDENDDVFDSSNIEEILKRFCHDPRVEQAMQLASCRGRTLNCNVCDTADTKLDDGRQIDEKESNRFDTRVHTSETKLQEFMSELDQELCGLESDSIMDYMRSRGTLITLHKNIQKADDSLDYIESLLLNFQQSLSGVSEKISDLQMKSAEMDIQLMNRNSSVELLTTFIDQIIVTPQLIKQICTNPIDEKYLHHLVVLEKKLAHAKQEGIREHASCAASMLELSRLKLMAITRIRDILIVRINEMKQPKTNVQILQRNVFLKLKTHFRFLTANHAPSARDICQLYVQAISHIYLAQFRVYVHTMYKLLRTTKCTAADVIGATSRGATAVYTNTSFVGNFFGMSSNSVPSNLTDKSNVFCLGDRDSVLTEPNCDPLIYHVAANKSQRLYYEEIFKSHQKLLMDIASSEYLFLVDFFAPTQNTSTPTTNITSFLWESATPLAANTPASQPPETLFAEIFEKTLSFFLTSINSIISTSYDSVGLLIVACINQSNRSIMQRRRIRCLDVYLNKLHTIIWDRLLAVITLNTESLKNASGKTFMSMPEAQKIHPHCVCRCFAELASALHTLNKKLGFDGSSGDSLKQHFAEMQDAMEQFIQRMSNELPNCLTSTIFKINNWDLILVLFTERSVTRDASLRLSRLLRDQILVYIESQLHHYFGELIEFIKNAEMVFKVTQAEKSAKTRNCMNRSGDRRTSGIDTAEGSVECLAVDDDFEIDDSEEFRQKIDTQRMERISRNFNLQWKKAIKTLREDALSSFSNFTNGTDILKQTLTQLLLYNSRFQKIVSEVYPSNVTQPTCVQDLVANNSILSEIRLHSQTY